jgi:hypothetical protein
MLHISVIIPLHQCIHKLAARLTLFFCESTHDRRCVIFEDAHSARKKKWNRISFLTMRRRDAFRRALVCATHARNKTHAKIANHNFAFLRTRVKNAMEVTWCVHVDRKNARTLNTLNQ